MTTIAYHHKDEEISIDSRCCSGTKILSDESDKSVIINGVIYFYTASADDGVELAKLIDTGEIAQDELNATVMFIKNKKVFMGTYSNGFLDTWELKYSDAIGSGCDFALAAIDFGCSARDAVKYAMTRDNATGGRVRTFDINGDEIVRKVNRKQT